MYYDAWGNAHESWPGELSGRMNNGGQTQQQNQRPQAAQPAQQPAQQLMHKTFDILFVDSRDEVDKISVNPGCDQIFAAKDDSFFAVKSAIGNTSSTVFYRKEDPKPAQQPVDMSVFARRDEIPALVSAAFLAMKKQQEAQDGTV